METPTIKIDFDCNSINETIEKVKQLVELLQEAQQIAESFFGNSDNAVKEFKEGK